MSKLCVTCGASFNGTERDLALFFKDQYIKHGVERFVYRLGPNMPFMFVKKESFNTVFNSEIKPNFINGSEYWSIQEFNFNQ